MNKEEFVSKYPDLHRGIKADGLAEATANDIAGAHPTFVETWKSEGGVEERNRISEIQEAAFDGQEELVAKLVKDGTSADEARKLLISDQKARTEESLDKLKKDDVGDLGASPAGDDTPAPQTAKTKQEAGDKLDAIARDYVKSDGLSYSAAFSKAVAEQPELFKIYDE